MSIHGHKVLNMMVGNSYTEAQLLAAVQAQFGEEARFHTCTAQDMSAEQLLAFLKDKGKFMPAPLSKQGAEFTVDQTAVCDHQDGHHHDHD